MCHRQLIVFHTFLNKIIENNNIYDNCWFLSAKVICVKFYPHWKRFFSNAAKLRDVRISRRFYGLAKALRISFASLWAKSIASFPVFKISLMPWCKAFFTYTVSLCKVSHSKQHNALIQLLILVVFLIIHSKMSSKITHTPIRKGSDVCKEKQETTLSLKFTKIDLLSRAILRICYCDSVSSGWKP